MAFKRIYIKAVSLLILWSMKYWAVYGQTWTLGSQPCPCVCTYASGPQLTLALGPGSYKQVDCTYQNLKMIPNNIPSDTEVLLLRNNNIKIITGLRNVQQLKYIDLSHNHISRILDDTFQENIRLEYLSLSWNELQVITNGAFQTLRRLSRLLMSGNQLVYVPDAVKDLTSLVAIDLTNNIITRVLSHSFEHLSNLQFVNLRSNLIQNVQANAFSHLPSLVNVQLSQNNIILLRPDVFLNVSRLSTLSMGYNNFKTLPKNQFVNIPSLESIHLEGNKINHLPGDIFQSLPYLQEVNLEENSLDILPSNIFRGRQRLQKIHLAGNQPFPPISSQMFDDLPNLVSLSVSQIPLPLDSLPRQLLRLEITDSSLSSIPQNFLRNLPSLESLELSENMISDIEEGAFDGLNRLQHLDISGNFLTSVPEWMFAGNLTALETIYLQDNLIERIFPTAFTGLVSLISLTLESNLIKELLPGIFPTSLEYLQLEENPIQYLDVDAISELTSLRLFSVDSSNFQCDCLLQHFIDWLSISHIIVDGAVDLRCKTPTRLRGVGLLQLDHRQIYCGPPRIVTTPKVQDVTVRIGFNITLPCSLLPYSVASVTWDTAKHSSLTMSNVFKTPYEINNYQLLPTGTLIVMNVSPLDRGTYTCTAANPAGTDIITYFVAVYQEKEGATTQHPLQTAHITTLLPLQTTNVLPIGNDSTMITNATHLLPQITVKPTNDNNFRPVTQVVVKVTSVLPGVHSDRTNVISSTTSNKIIIADKLTTMKTATKSITGIPTLAPTMTMTKATLHVQEPSQNETKQGPDGKSNRTHVDRLPHVGPNQNETSTMGTAVVGNIPTESFMTATPTNVPPISTGPCKPNPCFHRGTCKVVSIVDDKESSEDSLQFDSYSESTINGNDPGDEIDHVQKPEVGSKCICRQRFGGATCKIRKPELPYHVTVLDARRDVITLEWAQKNVGNVDGYRIIYSLVGDRDITMSMPIHPDVKSFTMEELQEESTYRICVVAFNNGGDSSMAEENCIWADTKSGSSPILALIKTEYGIIGGGVLFVILLTILTAACYSRGKKERDYERSVVIPRVSQSVADLPPSNVFRRSMKPRESAFYQDDMMLLDLTRQPDRKMYMNPFDSRHSVMTQDNEHINPPLGFGEGIPASLMPNNSRRTLRIQEDMV